GRDDADAPRGHRRRAVGRCPGGVRLEGFQPLRRGPPGPDRLAGALGALRGAGRAQGPGGQPDLRRPGGSPASPGRRGAGVDPAPAAGRRGAGAVRPLAGDDAPPRVAAGPAV
ncbi:MAG: hypothetical protein AVDCRST_MAG49-3335, partial [uncultured Thermomicrobiales bacterium]